MCIHLQVLHHLEQNPDGTHFDRARKTLEQVHRVLKPGGILSITAPTPAQIAGWWFTHLHNGALRRYQKRYMTPTQLHDVLVSSGFRVLNTLGIFGHELFSQYSDLEAPLRPSFRNSVFFLRGNNWGTE